MSDSGNTAKHAGTRSWSVRTSQFLRLLAVISAVALALRLGVSVQLARHPSVTTPASVTDMATYLALGREIAGGQLPKDGFYYQPFYYSVFLPAIFRVFGQSHWGIVIIQAILGAATVWLTGLVGARLFGRRTGLLAACLLALARFHIFYTPFALIAVLQAFWLSLLAFSVVAALRRDTTWRWAVTGLVAGLATLTRGNVLLLVPGLIGVLLWRRRRCRARAALAAATVLVLFYAPQLPFALVNYRVLGRWSGPSSAQDAVLALSNTPEAPPGGVEYTDMSQDWAAQAARPPDERVPVSTQVLSWARTQPLQFVELKLRTFLLFWNYLEIPNNIAMENEGEASWLVRFPLLVGFGFISTFALAGIALRLRKLRSSQAAAFTAFCVFGYCAATVVFYMLARFRVPIVPLLCVFAGLGLRDAGRTCRAYLRDRSQPRRSDVLVRLGVLAVAAFVALRAFSLYQTVLEQRVSRWLRPDGMQVRTTRSWILYDHGPLNLGQWFSLKVPPEGLCVRKVFLIPGDASAEAIHNPRLRIAFMAPPGDTVELTVSNAVTTRANYALEKRHGLLWATVPLLDLSFRDGQIQVECIFHGSDSDQAGPFVDFARNCERTIGVAPPQYLPTECEAVMKLVWDHL